MTTVLAIDAGQTGIKVRHTGDGVPADWTAPGIRTDLPLLPQLSEVLGAAAADGRRADAVGIGVSGLTDAETDAEALLPAAAALGARTVTLAHDSITAYLGAIGDRPGVVVAAGTGVVTLGVGADAVARVDGWGNIMGDAGSGYWIGREALDAVMRAYDGRGPATALTELVRERWPELPAAYIALQTAEDRVPQVASLSAGTMRLAEAGDAVAHGIAARAAAELALSAATALDRVGLASGAVELCAIGGVFASPLVREAFARAVAAGRPEARIVAPRGVGIDGAVALATLPSHHPLAAAARRAVTE